jgi:16S rRNA (uracil1498-N3)-methyltransferase
MRRRFFVEEFNERSATLRGESAYHLGRVLRAEPGQLYELSDGQRVWLARTERVGRDEVHFLLLEPLPAPVAAVHVELLVAIVKFDRFEWALEKATELGVDVIRPLRTERSDKNLIAAAGKRADRWKRILAESAQQARRLRIPLLMAAATSCHAFQASRGSLKLLLSERPGAKALREVLEPVVSLVANDAAAAEVVLAIGPEGGWTDAEFAAAATNGFREVALGSNILRTETAVCAALSAVHYAFGQILPGDKTHASEMA